MQSEKDRAYKPFTVEEAREEARTEGMLAARCRSAESPLPDLADTHSRLAATLRAYAELLEREERMRKLAIERMGCSDCATFSEQCEGNMICLPHARDAAQILCELALTPTTTEPTGD